MKLNEIMQVVLVIICAYMANANAIEQEHYVVVKAVIETVKSGDKNQISNLISYPLRREHPIPSVKNKEEFISRFDEIFDDQLIDLIVNSDVSKDWRSAGWRGIDLSNGLLWIDYDGKIAAINYQSAIEKEIQSQITNKQKGSLHKSISDYSEPILEWKTKKYHIRIDDLGDHNYRYVSWPISKQTHEKPDIVLVKGELEFDGSGGNHSYVFKNGKYIYRCNVWALGSDSESFPPGNLEVFKGKELLIEESVVEVLGQ